MTRITPRLLAVLTCLCATAGSAWGQVTIFSENMGTPSGTTSIAANTFQNSGTLTYGGTGDVRNSTASTGYTDSSGGGNVFLTNTGVRTFTIGSINTLNYSNFGLTFGAHKSLNASDLSELVVAFNSSAGDGSVTFPTQTTGSGTSNWRLITATSAPIVGSANLTLSFTNTVTPQSVAIRLDDVALTGTLRTTATTLTWNAGAANGNWFDGNWSGNNAPTASISGDALQFAGSTQTTTTNNVTGLTAASITFNTGAGAFTNNGNSLALTGDITNNSSSTQTISHNITLSNASHNLATTNGTLAIGGILSGTGASVIKTGAGTLVFSGTNTYTGATTVTGGTLQLGASGSINNSTSITVGTGATYNVSAVTGGYTLGSAAAQTLQGSGTVSGAVTVAAGSTLRGGSAADATGTLNLGATTLNTGSTLGVDLNGTNGTANSKLALGANAFNLLSTSANKSTITLFNDGGLTHSTLYTIDLATGTNLQLNGGTTSLTAADLNLVSGSGAWTFNNVSLQVNTVNGVLQLTFTPVPEPATVLAIGAAGLGLAGWVRRRRRAATV